MDQREHFAEAERLLGLALEHQASGVRPRAVDICTAQAQVHATLAHAAASARLAELVETLPTYKGMLAVYNFGGGRR